MWMRSTIGIELVTIVPKYKAPTNPSKKWDGHLPLCTMSNTYNNYSPKCMLMNYVGGDKTSLEEQTLTFEGLQEGKKLLVFEIR